MKAQNTMKVWGVATGALAASTLLSFGGNWATRIDFSEFEGSAGGFQDEGFSAMTLQTQEAESAENFHYDVMQSNGTGGHEEGQDGRNDMSIRTTITNGNESRWSELEVQKRRDTFRSDGLINAGTSKSGDYGLAVFEFEFDTEIKVAADDFRVRVSSLNGEGELYEWAFITLGTAADAPFSKEDIFTYSPTVYNDMSTSTFLNADGSISGNAGTEQAFGRGSSMSQHLTGQGQGSVSGGLIQPGWWAIDDFTGIIYDGPESVRLNPEAGSGRIQDNQTITGFDLGLSSGDLVGGFTVWMGYMDVAFDTDGDGFTQSSASPEGSIQFIDIGGIESIPEPSTALLLLAGLFSLLFNRKRPGK